MSNDQDISALIESLGSEDPLYRYRNLDGASTTLQKLGAPAVPFLIDALKSSNERLRSNAASVLSYIGDARAVEPLIATLNDEDWYVWRSAASALGRLGDKRAVKPLIAALESGKRFDVAIALGMLGDERAIEPLIDAFNKIIVDDHAPRDLVRGLAAFNDERVIQPLIEALHSDDDKTQYTAQAGLVDLGELAVVPLTAALQDDDEGFVYMVGLVLAEIKGRKEASGNDSKK